MNTIYRDILREKLGIGRDVVFVPMKDDESERCSILNIRNRTPSFKPLVDNSSANNYLIIDTFSYTFKHYFRDHNGKAYFFYKGKGHSTNVNEKHSGSIWEFDIENPNNRWLKDNMNSSYFFLTDVYGNEFPISFDSHTLHTQEIRSCDLFFMENYEGGPRNNLYTKEFSICDMFLEPLTEGDVAISNKEVCIIKNISFFACFSINFLIRERGTIHPVGNSYHSIFSRQLKLDSNSYFEMIDGVFHYVVPFIKAPDHVVAKIVEWKLTS